MFERLLVVTDLSPNSNALINSLNGLKNYGAEKCLLLNCLNLQESISSAYSYSNAELDRILQNQKETLEKQGFSVETRILTGADKDEINKIAVKEGYSTIVIGAPKHTLTSEVFFSGLAYDVIHFAQKPVLFIRLEKNKKDGELYAKGLVSEMGNHILFPTDFSKNADLAFTCLTEMAAGGAKKITLMHVQDESRMSPHLENRIEEFNVIDSERLQNMRKILLEKGNAEVKIVLKYGFPSIEILKTIDDFGVQLVVMGSQGRSFVKEFFLGSVSHNVARLSSSSVLLIPAKR